jgi:hypothetical protein
MSNKGRAACGSLGCFSQHKNMILMMAALAAFLASPSDRACFFIYVWGLMRIKYFTKKYEKVWAVFLERLYLCIN